MRSTAAKLGVLGALYFSQGLPFGFFTQALPVLLRKHGYSLGAIGLASLLALPWALKFLWAPLVDRCFVARIGRRKSWLVPLQVLTVVVLLFAALGGGSIRSILIAAFVINLLSATQDIAADGLAVDVLIPAERGLANGLQVAGYRVGMIVGGGALLVLHDHLGTGGTFGAMAALTLVASAPVLAAREPEAGALPAARSGSAIGGFVRRRGSIGWLALLVTYKAGDAFATSMLRPFFVDRGLGLGQIGWLLGTAGFVAGLLGALAGGALVGRLGRRRALIGFGLLQAAAVAGYAWLALAPLSTGAVYALCAAEHFAGGMATAALFTCMMDRCAPDTGATDYTVQASAVVIATGAASALGGFSAGALGYAAHFGLAAALALAAVMGVLRWFPAASARPALA